MRTFCAWAAVLLVLTGCHTAEPDLTEYASGPAEVPLEILGEMDEATREALIGEPKYVALTFDDGPRPGTTDRLLDGLLERDAAATFLPGAGKMRFVAMKITSEISMAATEAMNE